MIVFNAKCLVTLDVAVNVRRDGTRGEKLFSLEKIEGEDVGVTENGGENETH